LIRRQKGPEREIILQTTARHHRGTWVRFGVALWLIVLIACDAHGAASSPDPISEPTLKIGLLGEVGDLHPWRLNNPASEFIFYLTGRPIAGLNSEWAWQCFLCADRSDSSDPAAKYPLVKIFPRRMEVTWKIGDQISWGDGTPVTGYDVQYSWKLAKSPNFPVVNRSIYTSIEKVTVDPAEPKIFTVFFNTAGNPNQEASGFFLVPRHIEKQFQKRLEQADGDYHELSAYFTDPRNPGLANGPYFIADRQDTKTFILKANPYFFGKKPPFKKIVVHLETSMTQLTRLLEAKEIDLISESGQLPADTEFLEKWFSEKGNALGLSIVQADTLILEQISLNLRNPRLTDVRVRQALAAVIDRKKLVAAIGQPRVLATESIFHPHDREFAVSPIQSGPDISKAQEYLKSANWVRGEDNLLRQDNEILALEIATTSDNPIRAKIAEEIKKEWEKLGIKVSIATLAHDHFFSKVVKKANYSGAALFAWERDAATLPISLLDSREIPTARNEYTGQNVSSWENKKVDRIFDKLTGEGDAIDRPRLLSELEQEVQREVPLIPLFFNTRIAIVPKKWSSYQASGHQFPASLWIGDWFLGAP
jgi:peptide/nickel transport system substrate-binding protein